MRHVTFKIMLLAALALMAMRLDAASVDADAARSRASSFLQSQHQGRLSAPNVVLRLAHAEPSTVSAAQTAYYVFNSEGGDAFVIVAGDDRVKPILGYGNGSLDVERLPCNVRWWLDNYKRQIEWLCEHPELQAAGGPQHSPAEGQTIEPMVTCQWSQGEPYDWECAVFEGELCLTGCVATALAQVMYYWRYPDILPELPGYTSSTLQIVHEPLPSVSLDWDNMLDNYFANHYTEQEGHAVARLMRYCSQACNSDCSPGGTASSPLDQMLSLKLFGYSGRVDFVARDSYSNDEWRAMVDGELLSGRPVLYGGNDGSGGHAFVIDGYDNGLYHVNWGWGGYYDGFFELDLLDPYTGCAFMYRQDMVYQIYPADGDEGEAPTNYDFEVDGIYYRLQGNEALVTNRDVTYNSYSGHVEIPRTVTHEGVTYRVTGIGDKAFAMCENLESVSMPYIESIGHYSFVHCIGLREVTLGKTLKHGGLYSFYNSQGIERVNIEDIESWADIDFETLPANPMYCAQHVYCNGEELTNLVIGGQVQTVKQFTFGCNQSLKSVTFEEGVKDIGNYAFYECPNLERVTLPDGIRHVGKRAFYYCPSLTDLQIKGSVGTFDEYAFYANPFQGTLTFPAHVDTINYAAFCYCDFDQLVFHDVDRIVDYAFFSCPNLEQLSIQGEVKSIGSNVFENCSAMKRVDVNDLSLWCNITFDDYRANPLYYAHHLFMNGEEVCDLAIPAGVKHINDYAFIRCESLTSLTMSNDVESVGEQAFKDCKKMTVASLGDGVRTIGEKAFHGCSKLTEFTFGRRMKTAEMYAFGSCNALVRITSRAVTPPYLKGKSIFPDKVYNNAIVYAPRQSVDAYREALVWKYFNIEGVNFMPEWCDVNGDGEVNISDVTAIIDIQLKGGVDIAGDVNGDEEVNISDINAVIDLIVSGE